jgi:glycosyltransferase involved in cell wall biosynthesis
MNIAIVRVAHLGGGGMSRVIESWARILGRQGHSVAVVSEAGAAGRSLPAMENVRHLQYRSAARGPRQFHVLSRPIAACDLLRSIHREKPIHLIVSHSALLSIFLRRRLRGIPLLETFHSPLVDENRLNNWKYAPNAARKALYPATWAFSLAVERLALRSIDCAHTLSRFTWDRLRAMNRVACDRTRWELIPGTFDQESFVRSPNRAEVRRRLGIGERETILLTVRRLVPRNGVDRILSCARRLADAPGNPRFLIGGTGELKPLLERRIREEGLADRVVLLGFIAEERLASYYQAADAFLLPTRDLECFGLPVIEAMACGCVPLITPDGGPPEICSDFPECIAGANSDDAFVDLVAAYLRGSVGRSPDELASHAHSRYAEAAVAPAVTRVVDDLARAS